MSRAEQRPSDEIGGPTGSGEAAAAKSPAHPRAVRVGIAPASHLDGDPTFTVAPMPATTGQRDAADGTSLDDVLVDGLPVRARLHLFDAVRGRLDQDGPGGTNRTHVLFGPTRLDRRRGTEVREVVVGGWRAEVELEPERRAALRERARSGAAAAAQGGPVEVRAIIPGRVVVVAVGPGDDVEAGQQILVVEAMKMQNEVRAPREGSVERVLVTVGDTLEVGDLLVVIR